MTRSRCRNVGRRSPRRGDVGAFPAYPGGVTIVSPKGPGRLRRAVARLTAPEAELQDQELRSSAELAGATAVDRCTMRGTVCVAGTVTCVVLRPLGGVPTLEAELYDGTGTVTLVFLGRRRVRGVEPGRSMIARGRLTTREGRRTVFNPAYELRPTGV